MPQRSVTDVTKDPASKMRRRREECDGAWRRPHNVELDGHDGVFSLQCSYGAFLDVFGITVVQFCSSRTTCVLHKERLVRTIADYSSC
jgi:hypothetical protein